MEVIPQFDSIYGRRFPFTREGEAAVDFSDCYRTNLHQIHSLGYQITGNYFRSGIIWPLPSWTGAAEQNHSDAAPEPRCFISEGYQYLSIQLGSEIGYFKKRFTGVHDNRIRFYQYNQPRTTRDTLCLRRWEENWRIFYR